MGSILSGRHRTTSRGVVEQARPLDMRGLKRIGFIQPGRRTSGVMQWKMRGEAVGAVELVVDLRDPNFPFAEARLEGAAPESPRQRIKLTSTPCRFGGRRYYFACPHTGRRCEVLYSRGGGAFASRQAHRLVYQAQSEDDLGRLRRAVERSKERALGLKGNPRPRGANRERLIAEWSACEAAYNEVFVSESLRRFGFEVA
jgi:hypothetical protein